MYSMNLDSVREKNTNNQIMAEVSLMRAALLGNPTVLSPNQAMDSTVLQDIILENNKSRFQSNAFCKAVELGIVRVAIPEVSRNLIDCCINALSRGLIDPNSEFIISGLNFLYAKDEYGNDFYPFEKRCEVTKYIIKSLENARKRNNTVVMPEWLDSIGKELVDKYVESIILLDKAVYKYENFTSVKQLYPRILERLIVGRLVEEDPDTEIAHTLKDIHAVCKRRDAPIYRSFYYRFIENMGNIYSMETISEVRAIIDIAYNKIMAHSVSTDAEISVPNTLDKLSNSIIKSEATEMAFQSSYTTVKEKSCLDWSMIIWLYEEINAIMKEKGFAWREAVYALYSRESKMPFVLSGKYFCYTSLKVALSAVIPGGAVINFLQELISDVSGDIIGDHLPSSPKEMFLRTKKAKEAKKMLDTIIFNGTKDK